MRTFFTTIAAICLVLFASLAQASSTIRNPLRSLATLRNATIHTGNHRVTAVSDFSLSFILPFEEVKLVLEPNHDILPAGGATVNYLGKDGKVERTEQIDRAAHRVFKGEAWTRDGKTDDWTRAGWARITVRRDGVQPLFEGAFTVGRDNHHIQMGVNYERTRHPQDPVLEDGEDEIMVVYRDSDISTERELSSYGHSELRRGLGYSYADDVACGADTLSFNAQPDHPVYTAMIKRSDPYWGSETLSSLFGKRQIDSSTGGNSAGVNLVSTIGQTSGCPSTRKVALVGVATDCTYTAAFNSTESARQNIITQMNTASSLYERTFNISLGLQNLTLSDSDCPGTPSQNTEWNQACSDNVDIQDRLNYFSAWRGEQQDDNSHWTLLSTCNTGSAVGLAWLGQACVNTAITTNSSTTGSGSTSGSDTETVSGANVVVRTQGASEWQIIAHETGHTFGAVHDCTSTTCASSSTVSSSQCCPLSSSTCDAGEQYIMNPSTANGITSFSACSIGNICSAMGRNSVKTTCLSDNKGVSTISGQQCGNGIVEEGEDCDCGGTEGCGDNACCEPTTCKFKSGAVCDDSNEDCCHDCQLATNGTVCRASTGVCDPAETCTGSSATCPADVTSPDGSSCGSSGLQCASGQCTSRDLQCKTVIGSYTQGNDTYACDSSGCSISCASPEFGAGVCYGLQQNFLDGTSCGGGGTCQNGQCKGASVSGQVASWISSHKALVIGIATAIGALILFTLIGCVSRCLKRRRRNVRGKPPSPPPGGWQGWNARAPPPPPPVMSGARSGGGSVQPMWQDGYGGGGYGRTPLPPPPPPAYTARSVRYA
ncbi:hypothetical protein M8818_006414 [Zalaria obscura]|uniref:Uncharacterized protein n=1 Tax=Zalaria obscura TaxID=2024903 RepID=A0ACC3S6D7_9PEZI